jgi:hypothetical protein
MSVDSGFVNLVLSAIWSSNTEFIRTDKAPLTFISLRSPEPRHFLSRCLLFPSFSFLADSQFPQSPEIGAIHFNRSTKFESPDIG